MNVEWGVEDKSNLHHDTCQVSLRFGPSHRSVINSAGKPGTEAARDVFRLWILMLPR